VFYVSRIEVRTLDIRGSGVVRQKTTGHVSAEANKINQFISDANFTPSYPASQQGTLSSQALFARIALAVVAAFPLSARRSQSERPGNSQSGGYIGHKQQKLSAQTMHLSIVNSIMT